MTRFAEQNRNPRLAPIVGRAAAPLRVAVRGRAGVGRATVAAALGAAGVAVTADAADIDVLVIAEALKPDDRSLIDSARPTVIVLNKADLTGFGAGGPLALAHRRAASYRTLMGAPVVPMVALLAVASVDDELMAALNVLVHEPADLTSTDAFVRREHSVPPDVRRRLLDTLDRFGIAHALVALAEGAALPPLLGRLSLLERVVEHIDAAGAPIRYRRVQKAITELRSLAAQSGNELLTEFLSTDDTVLAVMSAAVDVVEAAGVTVDRGDDPGSHMRRAVHWRRYSGGPVNGLHRSCAADICRGSLRLLGRTQ